MAIADPYNGALNDHLAVTSIDAMGDSPFSPSIHALRDSAIGELIDLAIGGVIDLLIDCLID